MVTLILIVITSILFIHLIYKRVIFFRYWHDRQICAPPSNFIFGSQKDLYLLNGGPKYFKKFYDMYPNEKCFGVDLMTRHELVVCDPDMIKEILLKGSNSFVNRTVGFQNSKDILFDNLFTCEGDYWREARYILSPTFTSNKLKKMFYLIAEKGEDFRKFIATTEYGKDETECVELVAKFTTDIIGSCGFGVDMNSMMDFDAPFRKMGRNIFKFNNMRFLKYLSVMCAPKLTRMLNVKLISQTIETFFLETIREIVEKRKVMEFKRHDFIDLLLEIKQKNLKEPQQKIAIDDKFMVAQAFIFFAAGFETTSTLSGFILHELAHNGDIQEKVYQEIQSILTKYEDKLCYEAISELSYLDMVVMEGMRKYPVLHVLARNCNAPYKFENFDLTVEPGVNVLIPLYSIHHDPKYYPEPEKFIPERFTSEEIGKRHPMVYLPFGDGPRHCIG